VLTPEITNHFIGLYNNCLRELEHFIHQSTKQKKLHRQDNIFYTTNLPSSFSGVVQITENILLEIRKLKGIVGRPSMLLMLKIAMEISHQTNNLAYFIYSRIGKDWDDIFHALMMEALAMMIHFSIQIEMISCLKALYQPVIELDVALLSSVRLLCGTLTILLHNAMALDGLTVSVNDWEEENAEDMRIPCNRLERVIIDILHYGRSLPVIDSSDDDRVNSAISDAKIETREKVRRMSIALEGGSMRKEPIRTPDARHTQMGGKEKEKELIDEKNNLVPFPPAPILVKWRQGGTQEEYKQFMKARLQRETWENGEVLYKRKVEAGDIEGANKICLHVKSQIKSKNCSGL